MNERQFGTRLRTDGASFRLWAPAAKRVDLLLQKSTPMRRCDNGWFSADVAGVKAGARYKFRIDDEIDVPDPASAFQPDDVSGPSELIDHSDYRWRASKWRGRPWVYTTLIETHVGTFTREGTYRAMIGKLDHVVATGITALELMPLADFAGSRNWGYDGVLWYAPDSGYGRPDDLKTLIDEAHLRGLMVFLDVVYNHFGPDGKYRAQWNDDYHHAWHVLLTRETQGYYRDYERSPLHDIARALGSGFVYQGEASVHRGGQRRGEPSGELAPTAFVNFLENHDQIGNRALGDRLESNASSEAIEAALAVLLVAPAIPMLFMGEEWGSKAPFPFFCGFEGELAEAVRKGRRQEYAWAYAKYGEEVPDPLAASTFESAVLDWESLNQETAKKRLALVRQLIALRRREIIPRLAGAGFGKAHAADHGLLTASWRMGDGASLQLEANLSNAAIGRKPDEASGRKIWGSKAGESMAPWSVVWHLGVR